MSTPTVDLVRRLYLRDRWDTLAERTLTVRTDVYRGAVNFRAEGLTTEGMRVVSLTLDASEVQRLHAALGAWLEPGSTSFDAV